MAFKPFRPGEVRKCPDCGKQFPAREDWMIRCTSCYFIHRDGASGVNAARNFRGADPTPPRVEVRIEYRDRMIPDPDGQWFRDNLRDLLKLCHPDKHGNCPTATSITQHLIKRRKEHK